MLPELGSVRSYPTAFWTVEHATGHGEDTLETDCGYPKTQVENAKRRLSESEGVRTATNCAFADDIEHTETPVDIRLPSGTIRVGTF